MTQTSIARPLDKKRQKHRKFGEVVHWNSSKGKWLENPETLCLVQMIDQGTHVLFARVAQADSIDEHLAVLRSYLERWGRPLKFSTNGASRFLTARKRSHRKAEQPPPTQIGRALGDLAIGLEYVETVQRGIRAEIRAAAEAITRALQSAGVTTVDLANAYLDDDFLPKWNARRLSRAAVTDEHRPLSGDLDLDSVLCRVSHRRIYPDYSIRFQRKIYQLKELDRNPALLGTTVRVEWSSQGDPVARLDGREINLQSCEPLPGLRSIPPAGPPPIRPRRRRSRPKHRSTWMKDFWVRSPPRGGRQGRMASLLRLASTCLTAAVTDDGSGARADAIPYETNEKLDRSTGAKAPRLRGGVTCEGCARNSQSIMPLKEATTPTRSTYPKKALRSPVRRGLRPNRHLPRLLHPRGLFGRRSRTAVASSRF